MKASVAELPLPPCSCGRPATVLFNDETLCKDCYEQRGEATLEDLGDRQRHLRSVGETYERGQYHK